MIIIRSRELILKEVHQFIFNLDACLDDQVFQAIDLHELGGYYYNKTLQSINGITEEMLNTYIKKIAFRRSEPKGINDYYLAMCNIASIQRVPGPILNDVREKYNDIFVVRYDEVKSEIDASLSTIDQKIRNIHRLNSQIKANAESIKSGSFIKSIEADYSRIKELAFELRLLETNKEAIIKNGELLEASLMEYCNIQDPMSIEQALRKTAIEIAKEIEESTKDVEIIFTQYQIWLDVVEDNVKRPHALFYKVKFFPIIDEFHEDYRASSFRDPDAAIESYKEKMDVLPKIDDLHQLKQNSPIIYLEKLQTNISEYRIINRIKNNINSSSTLYNRKNILLKMLGLYESEEYELFANIAPVQIEGIITDYLYDELTFRRFTDMTIYPKAILREKLNLLDTLGGNLPPEAMLYFYYFFNSIIRNNIAHGAFDTLFCDDVEAKVFSSEILMDLLYITHVVSARSETEKMKRFVSGYIDHYKKVIRSESENEHFGALFNDLIGGKYIFNNGIVEQYRPLQVVYWILNPTYEKVFETVHDKKDLLELRQSILSKEFWGYISGKLDEIINVGYDYLNINPEFFSIVKGLFTCGADPETKKVLAKVNSQLSKIKKWKD